MNKKLSLLVGGSLLLFGLVLVIRIGNFGTAALWDLSDGGVWLLPLLMGLRETGVVPIHGINYKDKPDDAQAWLTELGDPYTRTGADISGRVAIDWGVYGVPETYVIGRDGRIAHKHIGPISPEALRTTIMPIIRELNK